MKRTIIFALSALFMAFAVSSVYAQAAAPKAASNRPAASDKAAQKVAKKALKEQEKAAKAQAKAAKNQAKASAKNQAAVKYTRPVTKTQTKTSTQTRRVAATSSVVNSSFDATDVANGTDAFASFEATFVAPNSISEVSASNEQSSQDVKETEEVLSPSAPR